MDNPFASPRGENLDQVASPYKPSAPSQRLALMAGLGLLAFGAYLWLGSEIVERTVWQVGVCVLFVAFTTGIELFVLVSKRRISRAWVALASLFLVIAMLTTTSLLFEALGLVMPSDRRGRDVSHDINAACFYLVTAGLHLFCVAVIGWVLRRKNKESHLGG